MDDSFIKGILTTERQRAVELNTLLASLQSSSFEQKEAVIRDIGNKTLHSCGGPTGVTGLPLILDICYPFVFREKLGPHQLDVHYKPEQLGTTPSELFGMAQTLAKAYASMTYRIYIAYQIDLAAKGYTGTEADDLAFYLSRKETYFPWYKTPGTTMRKFITIFDMLDVSAEDVGLKSEDIHTDIVRFYKIWIAYFPRRSWDSLVKHIISDRWSDHGQIGMIANRISPMEIDPEVSRLLKPDGSPLDADARVVLTKKYGMMFDGNNVVRVGNEADAPEDVVRARQLRFIRHVGHLNPAPHPAFPSLLWGAQAASTS